MSDIAIRVENLGKMYRIGQAQQRHDTLRDALVATFKRLHVPTFKRSNVPTSERSNGSEDIIWALKDVSFEVKRGEVVGIIGRNGAGKSTLLKILSRITEPTTGRVEMYGRVGSLLEVGTGFHPELTGRENIYLSGAILGMKKAEIDRRFDEIVAFAEIERFLDTPVKRYSSGMYVRLAFAVAAHLEPEILLVDEVLAVGDATFQKKCLGKMGDVGREGRTVLFVSHNMAAVQSLCNSATWLDEGMIRAVGPVDSVVADYLMAARSTMLKFAQGRVKLLRVILKDSRSNITSCFGSGDDIVVEVHFRTEERIEQPYFFITIRGKYGPICSASMFVDGKRPDFVEGDGVLTCRFLSPPLMPHQMYSIWLGIRDKHGQEKLLPSQEIAVFEVMGDLTQLGLLGEKASVFSQNYSVLLPYEWQYSNVTVRVQLPKKDPN